jgi:hypothetical protein
MGAGAAVAKASVSDLSHDAPVSENTIETAGI